MDDRQLWDIGVATFFLVILIIITIIGNIIVIVAVLTYHKLKEQHSNMFIMNLAVADLCVAPLVMIWSLIAVVTDMKHEEGKSLLIGMVSAEFVSLLLSSHSCL